LSDILRIEGGVVEGLPLYCDVRPERGPSSISSGFGSSVALSSNDVVETDSFFRRKPPLEDIVSKFLKVVLLLIVPLQKASKAALNIHPHHELGLIQSHIKIIFNLKSHRE
jgi:hypothetical protein